MEMLYTNDRKSKVQPLYERWNVTFCVGNLIEGKYYVIMFGFLAG
jgi:hypothetical protein